MRMTSKGQVTIPKHVRDVAGMRPGAELTVVFDAGEVKILRRKPAAGVDRGQSYAAWLQRVRGTATHAVSTDDILNATRGRNDEPGSR
jgi:antitoxin PrlF